MDQLQVLQIVWSYCEKKKVLLWYKIYGYHSIKYLN